MAYRQIHSAPANHRDSFRHAQMLLGSSKTLITEWGLNAVELQHESGTLRFERIGSEEVKSDFDTLLNFVAQHAHLAAAGVTIPQRVV